MKLIQTPQYLLIVAICICYTNIIASQLSTIDTLEKSETRNCTKKSSTADDSLMMDFTFKDTANRPVHLSDFKGKYVFVDMWYSGCGFCISTNKALYTVHEKLKNENIVFLSISVDSNREKWITSIRENSPKTSLNPWAGQYCPSPGTIILYTGGSGENNDFVKKYDPDHSYPKLMLIDTSGKLISDNPPRPDDIPINHPEKLVDFIMSSIKKKK